MKIKNLKLILFFFKNVLSLSEYFSSEYIIHDFLPSLAEQHSDVAKITNLEKSSQNENIIQFEINFDKRCQNVNKFFKF